MHKVLAQFVIAYGAIAVDGRTMLHAIQDGILQSLALNIWHNRGTYFAQVSI
jgi:hypothetical protein